ncbi:MAG: RNA-binding protein [Hyphomicrobiales bacterium]
MTERTCIITRAVRPVDDLIRFVLDPDGVVVPDLKCELPGRGVWVTADAAQVGAAVTRNAFARGFKSAARAGSDLVDLVGSLLARRALQLLSLANKAGLVRTGFVKVCKLIEERKAAAVVQACDGAADGTDKVKSRISSVCGGAEGPAVVSAFTGEQLSLALGGANVVHAALTQGRLTEEFVLAAGKYRVYWSERVSADAAG